MAAIVRLTVLTGPHKGSRFCLRGSGPALLGRANECDIRFCGDNRDLCISRRHCRLTFEPPMLSVEDLGSGNGTYINGHRCEPVACNDACDGSHLEQEPCAASDGDIMTVGGTSLQVSIIDCQEWQEEKGIKKNCTAVC
jgi:pSer/pThr/pTyr-binding forkhead associated (FHA) protein